MNQEEVVEKYLTYLKEKRFLKPKSWKEYESALKKLSAVIPLLEAKDFPQLSDALLELKKKKGWGPRTYKKNSKCIRYFYAWCAREKILSANIYPFDDIGNVPKTDPRHIFENEYKLILREQILDQQDRTMIMTVWDTAVRREELSKLDQADFDFSTNVLHVPRAKSKGNYSDRWIPFTRATAAALKNQFDWLRRHGVTGPAFVNFDFQRISPNRINERFKRITVIKENGERWTLTPHMLRHSFGIRMMKKYNVPQIIVMKWMGHQDPGMTNHYSHMGKEDSIHFYEKHVLGVVRQSA